MVESAVTINFELGERSLWRKASIVADCALLLAFDRATTGQALIDEDYLRSSHAVSDFTSYRCDPDVEPPRISSSYAVVGKIGDPVVFTPSKAKL